MYNSRYSDFWRIWLGKNETKISSLHFYPFMNSKRFLINLSARHRHIHPCHLAIYQVTYLLECHLLGNRLTSSKHKKLVIFFLIINRWKAIFYKRGRYQPLLPYFRLFNSFCFIIIIDVGSDRSANCSSTTVSKESSK